jgi:hypothetical protein
MKGFIKIIIGVLVIMATESKAQILPTTFSARSAMKSNPYLWNSTAGSFIYIVNFYDSLAPFPPTILIRAKISDLSGNVIGNTNLNNATSTLLKNGPNIFTQQEILDATSWQWTNYTTQQFNQYNRLPAQMYEIEIEALDRVTLNPLTKKDRRQFRIQELQAPILLKPPHEDSVQIKRTQSQIIFRWSPATPIDPDVNYRVEVYEVLTGQNPMQAFRSNMPILVSGPQKSTQYIWRPMLVLEHGQKFIWCVQSIDGSGNPVSSNMLLQDGRTQPIWFSIN